MPARFVLDRDGTIHSADADPDYTKRPEPADSIAVLDRLPR
jgi:peroxiredoxin